MSGSRVQHLQRRSGIYHLRIRVPDDIRSLVGLTEVRRSLHTYQLSRARILAAVCAARVFETFNMIKARELSQDQVRSLICNLFGEMKRETEDAQRGRLSGWEQNEQMYCSSEIAATVHALGAYNHQVQLTAQRALAPTSMRMKDLGPAVQEDLLDGAARALIERAPFPTTPKR